MYKIKQVGIDWDSLVAYGDEYVGKGRVEGIENGKITLDTFKFSYDRCDREGHPVAIYRKTLNQVYTEEDIAEIERLLEENIICNINYLEQL